MASNFSHRLSTFALFALLFAPTFCIISAKAEEEPGINVPVHDPAQIVPKALICFNDKYIYQSCEESYMLSASGNLDVAAEQTEAYCGGPCLSETHLVLSCIDNIFTNFVFYNRATIQDVRDAIHAGCGYGFERGHLLEHIKAEESYAQRVAVHVVVVLGFMALGHGLFV